MIVRAEGIGRHTVMRVEFEPALWADIPGEPSQAVSTASAMADAESVLSH